MTAILGACAGSQAPSPGGGGSAVQLSDQIISDAGTGPVTASYIINSTGSATDQDGTILENWLISGTASSCEVRATVTSGALTSGTTGSWLACSVTRSWGLTNSRRDNSRDAAVLTIQIRDVATSTVQASATVSLYAESDNFF